ncbi:aminoglycoside phosphotransferase [Mycobacterium sp. GA-2829]|nr:aminoglycoside phosphotransferase [Mycobacterium sp. GA-2829]
MSGQPPVLADWLSRQGETVNGPLAISRVGIGQSNITSIVVDAAGSTWVLREPPRGAPENAAHDLRREAEILQALSATEVPVPRVVGWGDSADGSPFLVMERVRGSVLETRDQARSLSVVQRRDLGVSVVQTLASLHLIDPRTLGLPVSRTPYLSRQMRRIDASWERVRTLSRHDADWQRLRVELSAQLPEHPPAAIMHGDYRLSNLLVDHGAITAVLDWELCTVGDPLADLAWLIDDWRTPEEPAIVMPSPTRAGGFPSRDEMIDIYQGLTGLSVDQLDYYRAFTQWRAASLLEGVRARRLSGAMGSHGDIDADDLEDSIGVLLASASKHLRRVG